jgi:hypothetical protein
MKTIISCLIQINTRINRWNNNNSNNNKRANKIEIKWDPFWKIILIIILNRTIRCNSFIMIMLYLDKVQLDLLQTLKWFDNKKKALWKCKMR